MEETKKKKVLLVVVDGLRPDAVRKCGDKSFEELFLKGSHTFTGRTCFPSITLPCHMSLFHSVDPERHGVYSNVYVKQNHPIRGLMEVLERAQKKKAFVYTWEQLRDLSTPEGNLDFSWYKKQSVKLFPQIEQEATAVAKDYIRSDAPDFCFLYLGGTDEIGHKYGWMSEEYFQEVRAAAACIRNIRESLPPEYVMVITADHGGHGRNHGEEIPEDMTIPILFTGAGFEEGRDLGEISIKDIAPTIAAVLDVEADDDWEGKSLL